MPKYRIAWPEGDELELIADAVINKTLTKEFPIDSLPKSQQAIIDAGGLIAHTRSRLTTPPPENFATRWQRTIGNLTPRTFL